MIEATEADWENLRRTGDLVAHHTDRAEDDLGHALEGLRRIKDIAANWVEEKHRYPDEFPFSHILGNVEQELVRIEDEVIGLVGRIQGVEEYARRLV